MRNSILSQLGVVDLILVGGTILSLAGAMVSLSPPQESGSEPPSLIATPEQVRLGRVSQVAAVPFQFTIRNPTQQDCVITEFLKPCSCTETDITTGSTIKAGGALVVHGAMETIGKRGASRMSMLVTHCGKDQESVPGSPRMSLEIPLVVDVQPAIRASPEVMRVDDSWTTLTLEPGTASSFAIDQVDVSDPSIQFELVDSRLGDRGHRFQLRLRLDRAQAGAAPGRTGEADGGDFWIKFQTSEANEPVIRIPIKNVAADFQP